MEVRLSEFRAHMARYLMLIADGQRVVLTSHGKPVAEIRAPEDRAAAARERLAAIARTASLGDLTAPAVDDFDVV